MNNFISNEQKVNLCNLLCQIEFLNARYTCPFEFSLLGFSADVKDENGITVAGINIRDFGFTNTDYDRKKGR